MSYSGINIRNVHCQREVKLRSRKKSVIYLPRSGKLNLKGIAATKIPSYTFLPLSGHHCF